MSLGDLVISLSANTARFESDMGKAAQLVERWGNSVGNSAKAAEIAISKMSSVGITSVDRLQQSFNTLNIKSGLQIDREAANIQAAFERIKNSGVASAKEISRAHTAMKERLDSLDGSNMMKGHIEGMNGFSLASVAAIAKIQILYSLINNMMSTIAAMPGVAVDAIENYKSSIVSNAAMITSMQVGVRDIGAAYRENKIYAEAVQRVLIKMDAETAASGKNLIDMNNQLMQQGVLLDANNKKQVDGFKNIANALAAITANDPNKDMQYAQEMRSLRDFSDRPGNRLVQYLKSQGVTKEMVEDWKKIGESTSNYGYVLEQLNPYFKGFAAAQGDINDLWETGKSTLVTIRDDVLRGGLSEGFSHIIDLMKELNKWAEENKFKIQAMIKDGFNQLETTAKTLWNMRGAFVALGEAALYGGILIGVGSIIIKIQELAKAITTMNLAASSGILVKVLSNPVAAVGALTIGTAALAINDSMDRSKAEAEANKIGAFAKQDILPGHVAEIRKKYGPISAQEIMGKFANSEITLETVLSDSYEYIGQRVIFNEAAIAAAKVPYPKGIKTAGGTDAKTTPADYTDRWNTYVSALRSFENKGEGNLYAGQIKKIDEQLENLKATYGGLDAAHKKMTDGLHEGGAIKYFVSLAKVLKDTAWYLNIQKEAQAGLDQVASDKALFNIANMNGDLSTKRYNVTNLYDKHALTVDKRFAEQQGTTGYRLRSNDDYQIAMQPTGFDNDKDKIDRIRRKLKADQMGFDNSQMSNSGGMWGSADNYRTLENKYGKDSAEVKARLEELAIFKELDAEQLASRKELLEQQTLLEEKYVIDKKKIDANNIVSIGQNLGQIASIMMKGNKEQFEAGKKLAIATATVQMFAAAAAAFAGITSSTGGWGIAAAIAAAAVAVATGSAQIAQITSTEYQGREFGGPVTAGQSYIVGEKRPELFTPGASGVITPYVPSAGQGQTTSITQVFQVSTGVGDTVRSEISRMMPMFSAQAVAAVQQAQRDGRMQYA